MNAKNLMLRAALAASVVGSLGFAGLSPASATLITLGGPGSDFGGESPYSESGSTSTSNTGGFVGPYDSPSVETVTPTGDDGVHTFDVTSEQFSLINRGNPPQDVTFTGTTADAKPVAETSTAPDYSADISTLNLTGFEHPVSSQDKTGTFNFTPATAPAKPDAVAIALMLMGVAGLGLAARRLLRKVPALSGA